jgi:hypothetical protein
MLCIGTYLFGSEVFEIENLKTLYYITNNTLEEKYMYILYNY